MSDAFEEIQAIKIKRNSLREKLQKRKRERHELFTLTSTPPATESSVIDTTNNKSEPVEYEQDVLRILHQCISSLPITSTDLTDQLRKALSIDISFSDINKLLEKLSAQDIIRIKEITENDVVGYTILSIAESNSQAELLHTENIVEEEKLGVSLPAAIEEESPPEKQTKLDKKNTEDIMSLISMPTIREKESKKVGEQILDLLSKQTSKEKSLAERFRSQGGAQVMEFCPHGTRTDCSKLNGNSQPGSGQAFNEKCKKLHFKKILQSHTDESLGDCSFLNTCFHMDTCKYVHYEVDGPTAQPKDQGEADTTTCGNTSRTTALDPKPVSNNNGSTGASDLTLYPPQWIQCDLRYLDMTVLGKFAVIMADPPWDIHMELPYGTMSDDEMRQLGIPTLQDEGLLFLWVTGRAMELGRECLQLWGYDRVDEIIWVKTNQLQRIIRTGRTGHWLNHGKEHCLVGMKGFPRVNRGLDSDVIVAEVRATSHKPDEIYGIIERMSPGTRKIELFGRPHNVQPNWITLGNQVDGVRLIDPQLIKAFKKRYPDGNSMKPSKS
ncbi:N6-adenosine-methyltransferase subunit METTL3 [Neodiprion lecontei]|uniref:mRNA m(6)A methyltransferase n=1 Tax=Neodiprion lecontei TaxID=441921 RepID=A0A6J0CC87_NEOLC|nr:N6-adenosine-methyltransferase subunit METTL3 [Neodiprion lecontei]XP_046596496.1 N6-adenosine-methyltransferase subunit METTL3 [Neodiprion lecontei]